jgi:hypothetical protein
MKLNTLFVSSFVLPKVPYWRPSTTAITSDYWNSAVATNNTGTQNIVSLQLSLQAETTLTAIPLNELALRQQHVYNTVAAQPIDCSPTVDNIIQFLNGRSPYTTKQDIL